MIYPKWINQGDKIGVTATSDGVSDELDRIRFQNGIKNLNNKGYNVTLTNNVFTFDKQGRSSSGQVRGTEFNELVRDKEVSAIYAAKGGNFLNEMLPFVDYEEFVKNPKWFQGYSDNTGLTHTLTTKYDVATIYGSNFSEFGMEKWHKSVCDNLAILSGEDIEQHSYDKYQYDMGERTTGLEGYNFDKDVYWKTNSGNDESFRGRLIGGCLDVLIFLQGTKYDETLRFIEKYKQDGIIWYLESFDISGENIMMFLWQLKEIGWFKYTKGFMFGRPLFYKEYTQTSYEQAVEYALAELNVPIIFDCDFGHRGPRMTMINGAIANVTCNGKGQGSIRYEMI